MDAPVRLLRRVAGLIRMRSVRPLDTELPLLTRAGAQVVHGNDVVLSRVTCADLLRPHATHVSMVVAVLILVIIVFAKEDGGAARMWVLIGLLSYIASRSWGSAVHLLDVLTGRYYLRVHLSSQRSSTLFNAVTEMLAMSKGAIAGAPTLSRDCECFIETDYVTGEKKVKFGFGGRGARRETVRFVDRSGSRHVASIDYERGDDVICGREAVPTAQRSLTLSMKCSGADLSQKHAALLFLCQAAYDRYTQPEKGTVDVYFPYTSSTEWAPEWKRERSISICQQSDTALDDAAGLRYYLPRDDFNGVLNDAKLWSQNKLRVYIICGPPGVGKSHFVTRLAQALALPVYRARLMSLSLGDDSLQQLFSASVMLHDSALVHFDEFQGVLESWRSSGSSEKRRGCSVTEEGFNEFLQGGRQCRRVLWF